MTHLAGIDIGGTKCAVCIGRAEAGRIEILDKRRFATPDGPEATLVALTGQLATLLEAHPEVSLSAVGVSCGGPLDSVRGLILSPPNLPGWDRVDVVAPFRERFGVPAALQNDANACAIAEWQWGAGRGVRSMVFLTFGTTGGSMPVRAIWRAR